MQENKNISPYRQSLKARIVDSAMKAFAMNGIRAVKMDDIAQQMGISKRTLYEIYDNKEDLLYEGVKKYKQRKEKEMMAFASQAENVMDVILHAYRQRVEEDRLMDPQFYSDMVRYPRVLSLFEEDRRRDHEALLDFMNRGVKEGYFRRDVDYELVSQVFDAIGHHILQNSLYKRYSVEALFKNLIFVSLRGFCTAKGVSVLDCFLNSRT